MSEFINFQVSNSDSNNGNEKWTLKAWWQRCWSNPSNYSGLTNITRSFSDTEKDVLSDDDIERYENQETEGRNHASSDDDAQWDMFADSKNKMEILLKLWEFQVEKERKNLSSALFVTPFNMYKVKLKINVEMINCWRGNFLIVSFQITGMLVKRQYVDLNSTNPLLNYRFFFHLLSFAFSLMFREIMYQRKRITLQL